MVTRQKLLERAKDARRESKLLDFKSGFDLVSAADWCELIKDIAAFANSGGGVVVFGVNNDGGNSSYDISDLLAYDLADVTNKIEKYTGHQFSDLEFVGITRNKKQRAALLIFHAEIPLIFTRPGTYDVGDGKQKTAFGRGTLYFRHGAKSEPGNRDDLIRWRDEALARIKDSWLSGIRKVVEAPEGHTVAVVPTLAAGDNTGSSLTARISSEPSAMGVIPANADEIWPHRQKDVIRIVNQRLKGSAKINSHDILCITKVNNIFDSRPDFVYKPYRLSSPHYSTAFVDWVVESITKYPSFRADMRKAYRKSAIK